MIIYKTLYLVSLFPYETKSSGKNSFRDCKPDSPYGSVKHSQPEIHLCEALLHTSASSFEWDLAQ